MRIDISSAGSDGIALHEPDDFRAFSVLLADEGARAELGRLGRVADDDHVFVDPEKLKALAGDRGRDPDWLRSLDAMLAFAAEHGWVADDGFVRAHVERA